MLLLKIAAYVYYISYTTLVQLYDFFLLFSLKQRIEFKLSDC